MAEPEEKMCSHQHGQMPELKRAKILPVDYNLMVMHKLMEMG